MAKYKVGITEAGDAGIDLSWAKKLDAVNGAVLVTKNVTSGFISKVLENPTKLIIHATCTGYGGTAVEPNVPAWQTQASAVQKMVLEGFPKERVVIRVDPIIPTERGLERALEREKQQPEPCVAELCRRFVADEEDFSEERLRIAGVEERIQNLVFEEALKKIEELIGRG